MYIIIIITSSTQDTDRDTIQYSPGYDKVGCELNTFKKCIFYYHYIHFVA